MKRRHFINIAAGGAAVALSHRATRLLAQTSVPTKGNEHRAEAVTRQLARFLVSVRPEEIPPAVRREATRTLVNFIGVAVGGSRHEAVERALAAIGPFAGPAQAQILGRRERLDAMHATLINGISSHVLNFDDTHLSTIIHASSTIVPPAIALAEYLPEVTGAGLLHAIVLGMETAFRIGAAVYPNHFDAGWHITGTAGAIGAAAASGRLLRLTEPQMVWALGLAASQPVGLRESFGSMNKSFNPGRAAQNGLLAALLAARNFTSSDEMLEAKSGWVQTLSTKHDLAAITEGLGVRYEVLGNTYLPFACAIVLHPAIDGCLRLKAAHGFAASDVGALEVRVHPRVLQLSGKPAPTTGLEGKFSIYHSAAIALIAGQAGPRQFTDEAVRAPATVALRDHVTVKVDSSLRETQARVTAALRDGRKVEVFVENVIGSLENPMTDAALTAKAIDLMENLLSAPQGRELLDACWTIERMPRAARLAPLAAAT